MKGACATVVLAMAILGLAMPSHAAEMTITDGTWSAWAVDDFSPTYALGGDGFTLTCSHPTLCGTVGIDVAAMPLHPAGTFVDVSSAIDFYRLFDTLTIHGTDYRADGEAELEIGALPVLSTSTAPFRMNGHLTIWDGDGHAVDTILFGGSGTATASFRPVDLHGDMELIGLHMAFTAVPEAGTLGLMSLGMTVWLACRWMKPRRADRVRGVA